MKFPAIDIAGGGALRAALTTSLGRIVVRLDEHKAPHTVANFVGLATGRIDWIDPKSGEGMSGTPFYDGLLFHRVVRNFVVQCGDPKTRHPELRDEWGTGHPGYHFDDELALRHNRAGVLSMANSGPNTNGSQFFITEVPAPHLDKRHSAFGLVTAGLDVVAEIADVDTGDKGVPLEPVVLRRVEIFRQ